MNCPFCSLPVEGNEYRSRDWVCMCCGVAGSKQGMLRYWETLNPRDESPEWKFVPNGTLIVRIEEAE